jgi:hypothetical protein
VADIVRRQNIEFSGADAGPLDPGKSDVKTVDRKFVEFRLQEVEIETDIEQSPDRHVAADSRKTVKVKGLH